jgi:hypothetical protein
MTQFYESLFAAEEPQPGEPSEDPSETDVAVEERRLEATPTSLGELGTAAAAMPGEDSTARREAVRRIVERRLVRGNPEVTAVVAYAAKFLDANPRQIKRFVNLFRFFVMIHTERSLDGLPTVRGLTEVAKLGVLSMRWPSLLPILGRRVRASDAQTLFELLEQPGEGTSVQEALENSGLTSATIDRLLAQRLQAFLTSEPALGGAVRAYL